MATANINRMTRFAPQRETTAPVKGIAQIDPNEVNSSSNPIRPGLASKYSRTTHIREGSIAIVMPEAKKMAMTPKCAFRAAVITPKTLDYAGSETLLDETSFAIEQAWTTVPCPDCWTSV
jgi:hypothetical protein